MNLKPCSDVTDFPAWPMRSALPDRPMRRRLPLMLGALLALAVPASARAPHQAAARHEADSSSVVYANGMVSAADPRAAEAGVEMLRAGGNAVDAAFATLLALNVVEPQSSGIGGGGFLEVHRQRRLDQRGRAGGG